MKKTWAKTTKKRLPATKAQVEEATQRAVDLQHLLPNLYENVLARAQKKRSKHATTHST